MPWSAPPRPAFRFSTFEPAGDGACGPMPRLPWWLLRSERRVPGTRLRNYLSGLRFAVAGPDRTVTDCVGDRGVLFERFWEPLAVAALNTPAESGASCLLWPVLRETFARGAAACRPRIARFGLSHAFVDPALKLLGRRGAAVQFGRRLRRIACAGPSATCLHFGSESVAVREGESVILAVPPAAAAALVPSLTRAAGEQCHRQRSLPPVRARPAPGRHAVSRADRRDRAVAFRARGRGLDHGERPPGPSPPNRPRRSPVRPGTTSPRPLVSAGTSPRTGSSRNGAPPSRRLPGRSAAARRRDAGSPTCIWPGTGSTRVCPRPSRAPFARVTWPPAPLPASDGAAGNDRRRRASAARSKSSGRSRPGTDAVQ